MSKTLNSSTTGYLYDGADAVQEIAGGSAVANMLVGGVNDVFTRTDNSGTWNRLADGLGSTLALADSSGVLQTQYTYEAFGGTTTSGAASGNSSQYTSRENDGTGLYYYRARYYSPSLQRFISEDSIGLAGGINLYSYVSNDPINFRDPTGLRQDPGEPDRDPVTGRITTSGRKDQMSWGDLFLKDLIAGPITRDPVCKSWGQRWWDGFKETNATIPGFAAPPFAAAYLPFPGASVGAKVSEMAKIPTFVEWARTGFQGMRMGAAMHTPLETGLSVAGGSIVSTIYVTIAFEGGIAIGSAINATFPRPCGCQ